MINRSIICTILLFASLTGCSTIIPSEITAYPNKNTVNTAGIGESIYTYRKTAKARIDYDKWAKETKTYITDSVQQELIYSGYSKGVLKIKYREYANDLARSSYYQDVTYDYTPSTIIPISFKGAKIEVLNANNNEIKYEVLNGFSNEEPITIKKPNK